LSIYTFDSSLRLDDQQILRILFLGSVREVERSGYYRFLVNDHDEDNKGEYFCRNIQDFSEYVEEIRDIFKRMVILLKIPNFYHDY
jgi:hypothetical protein